MASSTVACRLSFIKRKKKKTISPSLVVMGKQRGSGCAVIGSFARWRSVASQALAGRSSVGKDEDGYCWTRS